MDNVFEVKVKILKAYFREHNQVLKYLFVVLNFLTFYFVLQNIHILFGEM